ncbi:MAG: amino acid ABC transporter ATP-binding protein [Acetobacteraceae bacterium]
MLDAGGVAKTYGGQAVLHDVSLSVTKGELVSIIGPSGCGKSTFLRCLNLLEVPDRGRIRVHGVAVDRNAASRWTREDERQAHALRAHVGMVFQSFNLFLHRTVLDNVMLAPRVVKKMSFQDAKSVAEELLIKVGLGHVMSRYSSTLSGGQQQRAAIARAMAMKPDVILYDEPTSALDPELAEEVLQVMRALDDEGMTQIVVTHDMRFARAASDRVLFMDAGHIIEAGDPDIMFARPEDARTRRFLRTFL